jgi:NADH dehydrogenase FAD-containing subunit
MPRIVIIGGGPAGIHCAQTLANNLSPKDETEVVLLEKSKYFYHAIGAPRAFVDKDFSKNLFIPYDHSIPDKAASFVKIVRGEVTGVNDETNQVEFRAINDSDKPASGSPQRLDFDYLVLATGSTYPAPIKQSKDDFSRATTERQLDQVRENVAKADKVLIVGGGAVGIEVAGEIKSKYPDKKVTIVDGGRELLGRADVKPAFRSSVMDELTKKGVDVVLGERLDQRLTEHGFQHQTLTTTSGKEIESDVQLVCTGFRPLGELVEKIDPALVTAAGAIKVNAKLQVASPRLSHVFALGDASDHPAPKMAFFARAQAKFLGNELAKVARKEKASVTKEFPQTSVSAMILSLGPNGGVSQLPVFGGLVLGDWVTRSIKSRNMLSNFVWPGLNATLPSPSK